MSDENKKEEARVQADNHSIAVGGISAGGNIGDINISTGYSVEQVTVLIDRLQSTFQPKPFDGGCPYKGLDVFEEEDAELFFGREKLVEDLVSRVKDSRTVFVTGPSGSGKSSLVRAGLIHAMRQGKIKSSERWLYATLKPGRDPVDSLANAFSRLKSPELGNYFRQHVDQVKVLHECAESALTENKTQRLVLFIDQFEEVFTQISNEAERSVFLNLLTHAATAESGRVIILFSMRSDFVSNCAAYPQLNEILNQQFVQIGAMQPQELVSAIAQPALRVGLRIDPDLIAQIINEMKGEPGALPLMQFALKDLFDSQKAKNSLIALTLNDYLLRGGIHKALERHADDSYSKLSRNEQELTRSIFSRLIEVGRGVQDTRRTALFNELVPQNAKAQDVESIIQKLADARLVTTDEQAGQDTVTISHEKLIDAWPWLKKLVNENRDVITLQNEIANDAKEWNDHQREKSYLYIGARLVNAREQLDAKKIALSGLARDFVKAGYARQRQNAALLIAGVSTIIVFLVIAVIVFSRQSSENADLAKQAHLRELAAQSSLLRDQRFQTSLLLGLEVYNQLGNNPQTLGLLLDHAQSHPQLRQYLMGHAGSVNAVAISPDGKILASGSADGQIIFWDLGPNKPIEPKIKISNDLSVNSLAFSPDGKILAFGSEDGTVTLWDVDSRQSIGAPLSGHSGQINSVAFSPDGNILASGSDDKTIIFWDVDLHEKIGQALAEHSDRVNSITFGSDGTMLASASADGSIILWNVETQQPIGSPLQGHTGSVQSVAISPDGKLLASGSEDTTIMLWDIPTQTSIGQPLTTHSNRVNSIAFSPDGKTFASGSYESSIIIWDSVTHQAVGEPLNGHTGSINSIAYNPDGKTLVSGGIDTAIILWNTTKSLPIGQIIKPNARRINSAAFSPDGKMIALGALNNSVTLWDADTYQPIGDPLTGQSASINSVAFSPDGNLLASGSADKTILLRDAKTQTPIGTPLTGHSNPVNIVAFSPDGATLASGDSGGVIVLWDVETHDPIGPRLTEHTDSVNDLVFSADGKMLTSASSDGAIILWDLSVKPPQGQSLSKQSVSVNCIAFSPDGKILAAGNSDGAIILWDMNTREVLGQPLLGHSGLVKTIVFSPDGTTLASGGFDSNIILWDVVTRQPIGQPLTGHTGAIFSLAYKPNSKTLASGSIDNTVILWNLDPQIWVADLCRRVGRTFTQDEWKQFFENQPYLQNQSPCDQ